MSPCMLSKAVANAGQPDPDDPQTRGGSAQDDLISRAAHELRGPLGSIANWIHLLTQSSKDEALQQQGLAAIQRSVHVCKRLLEEMSDVSALRSGRLRLHSGLVDLVSLVDMALERPRAAAREKGVELELVRELASVPVMGDPDRLQQIVLHLLSNAVKFTPAGGRVTVTLARDGASWRLSVADTGAGIAPDLLPRLFDGLRDADFAAPRAAASLGVGLALVRHLAELHGGSVEAASSGPGRGAAFVVRLPVPALVPSTVAETRPAQGRGHGAAIAGSHADQTGGREPAPRP